MYHYFLRRHVCLSNLKHAPSRELPLTARKTVFSHLNYVGMSKDMEKRLPQLYYIKMKISYDLGFIAIGMAIAT